MKVIYMKSFLFILFFIAFANIGETQVLTNTNKFSLVKEIPLKDTVIFMGDITSPVAEEDWEVLR